MRSNEGSVNTKEHAPEYLAAAAMAAALNFPLWRASAMGQSGFRPSRFSLLGVNLPQSLLPYLPPYKGFFTVVAGMAWARGFIFFGSDRGKELLHSYYGVKNESLATVLPPLILTTIVQCVNQPLVRSSITLQDPQFNCPNTGSAIKHIYEKHGLGGLYLGLSVQLLKSIPMFCCVILVKDYMEKILPPVESSSPTIDSDRLWRSAVKSATAGVAGAVLTNPLDVIRNEMFKKSKPASQTIYSLHKELGFKFLVRGVGKNMMSVAMPIGCTIFFTDALIQLSLKGRKKRQEFEER